MYILNLIEIKSFAELMCTIINSSCDIVEVKAEDSIEIDTHFDLRLVRLLFRLKSEREKNHKRF